MAEIILKNVTVEYPIYETDFSSFRRKLINIGTRGRLFGEQKSVTTVRVLENISFTLKKGDRLGLVGENGAGKSTLLKTIAQFFPPTSGTLQVNGKVSALFNVCFGMDMNKSGYENIYHFGILLGYDKKTMQQFVPDIEEFSELNEFLNMPVRTYSDGMKVRLGFAICTCVKPDILLLDEAIGAGDMHFMRKATERASELYERASLLILASHATKLIEKFCNKALWLHQGKAMMLDDVDKVITAYEEKEHQES